MFRRKRQVKAYIVMKYLWVFQFFSSMCLLPPPFYKKLNFCITIFCQNVFYNWGHQTSDGASVRKYSGKSKTLEQVVSEKSVRNSPMTLRLGKKEGVKDAPGTGAEIPLQSLEEIMYGEGGCPPSAPEKLWWSRLLNCSLWRTLCCSRWMCLEGSCSLWREPESCPWPLPPMCECLRATNSNLFFQLVS